MMYDRSQRGTWITVAMVIWLVILGVTLPLASGGARLALLPLLVIVLAVAAVMHKLRVQVSAGTIELAFGFGVPSRSIPLSDVESVEVVKNRWWYGWGVRRTPTGWLWNVNGLDAVEIKRSREKPFRIGTDDPEGLAAAIREAAGLRGT